MLYICIIKKISQWFQFCSSMILFYYTWFWAVPLIKRGMHPIFTLLAVLFKNKIRERERERERQREGGVFFHFFYQLFALLSLYVDIRILFTIKIYWSKMKTKKTSEMFFSQTSFQYIHRSGFLILYTFRVHFTTWLRRGSRKCFQGGGSNLDV